MLYRNQYCIGDRQSDSTIKTTMGQLVDVTPRTDRQPCLSRVEHHSDEGERTTTPYEAWFRDTLGLPQYHQPFVDAGYINLTYLDDTIDETTLIENIGISNASHRKTILQIIKTGHETLINPRLCTESDDMGEEANLISLQKEIDGSFSDEEFEDDDTQWDDLDIIPANEQIFRSICSDYHPSSVHTEFEECWECTGCETMNNVKLTTRQYNYKCCGCGDVCYIPSQTQTSYQSKWDTHNDYLLRTNKIWICNQCTQVNHSMTAKLCAVCHASRFVERVDESGTQCNICHQYIHSLSFLMHEIHCTQTMSKPMWWRCPKCHGTQTTNHSKCSVCHCKQPTTHQYLKARINQDLIFGFCRGHFAKEIPVEIKSMIADFYAIQTFEGNLTRHYNEGFDVSLFGDVFVNFPNKNVWKVKLNVDETCVVRVDGDTSAGKVHDVCIGVWCNAYRFDKKSGKVIKVGKYFTITGDGRHSYPIFRNNDVIIVELDCKKHTLSFGINEDWYGVAFSNLPDNTEFGYKLYINVKQQGAIVNSIN